MRTQSSTLNRPYPFVLETEIASQGLGIQSPQRPRLAAQWIKGNDGKLICRWVAA